MRFTAEENALIGRLHRETLKIEGWGSDGLRVRSTILRNLPDTDHALTEEVAHNAEVKID
jgi:alpha-D-xyloside xylohydrolase